MNKQLEDFAREQLKTELAKLPKNWQHLFKQMYSHENLDLPIGEVIDEMPASKLDWAMHQVENSIKKREAENVG